MNNDIIQFRIPSELKKELIQEADKLNLTLTSYLKLIISKRKK